jgi:L-lactate dehydrogenase
MHLSKLVKVNPTSIHTYVLGEHGDSSFAPSSTATIGGKPLIDFEEATHEHLAWAHKETKNDAYKIIAGKGATYYGIAAAVSHIVDVVKNDKKKVVPLSTPLNGQYGLEGVALSLPCILGRDGVEKVLDLPLTLSEQDSLMNSARIIRDHLN